ncbi:MAG: flavodoxin-dependent (E)-4-hydroxy-3-methylbut-2-enyl-diphosphate synthase [Defluviitaleaceae bacterium]|nr:flavodoxin-dependent (E)-4-hydroxy-3-methylbut-2-enyl-diphosphate synthase [Defluviitaleaceae bacterium]
MYNRRISNVVSVGGVKLGGTHPITIQSMTNTDTRDIAATVRQIHELTESGCEIVRVAVPDKTAAEALGGIKRQIRIPLVADIHFDHRLALESVAQGVDKLRLNPGNIGDRERVKLVVAAAAKRGLPIRIGVNSGSLEKDVLARHGGITPAALCESALNHVRLLEELDFGNIVISIKASGVPHTLEAYRLIAEQVPYPMHIGITEAGTLHAGTVKSAAGIAALLSRGIGDTIRVSLTADPVEEVRVAREILQSMELRCFGPVLISCPTCGRTEIDLIGMAEQVENFLETVRKPIKVAVMGCVVNGPGEAKDADIGIAGGKGSGIIFAKGKVVATVPEDKLLSVLFDEIRKL